MRVVFVKSCNCLVCRLERMEMASFAEAAAKVIDEEIMRGAENAKPQSQEHAGIEGEVREHV